MTIGYAVVVPPVVFRAATTWLINVLVSLGIYHSVQTGNLLVLCSVLNETFDFLLSILEVTAATFKLKSQFGLHFFNQTFSFAAAILLFIVFHLAKTVHNPVESCSHLVTGITDIRIRFVAQIAETSFCCETVVKNFFTNTSNIFCYFHRFLGLPHGQHQRYPCRYLLLLPEQ